MKYLIFIFCLIFCHILNAQNIQGNWRINDLILNSEIKEYALYPLDPAGNGGNSISINHDGTFVTSYSAECGNDCFRTSVGEYTMEDENHIKFKIKKITYSDYCSKVGNEHTYPIEVGSFYIDKKQNNYIKLIKTQGIVQQDIENAKYSDLIEFNFKESKKYENLLKWTQTNFDTKKSDQEIADFYASENNLKSYEVLYSKNIDYNHYIILIKVNNDFSYLFCNKIGNEMIISRVALFDKSFMNKTDNLVKNINANKNLKLQIVTPKNEGYKKKIKIYRDKTSINKITIEKTFESGKEIGDFYLENDVPIFAKISISNSSYITGKSYYITGKISNANQYTYFSKKDSEEGFDISDNSFDEFPEELDKIIQDSKR